MQKDRKSDAEAKEIWAKRRVFQLIYWAHVSVLTHNPMNICIFVRIRTRVEKLEQFTIFASGTAMSHTVLEPVDQSLLLRVDLCVKFDTKQSQLTQMSQNVTHIM